MQRQIARFSAWWIRLFVVAVVVVPWLGFAAWIDLAILGVLFGLGMVRTPWNPTVAVVEVDAPVRGRWVALNSPATKVPSHGTRAYGQTYAIDVLHPRPKGASTSIGWGPGMRAARTFSTFGAPVHSMADGVVVAASSRRRDHRSRLTWPSLVYLVLVETPVRTIGGARFVLGNHVVVDHGDGVYSAYAHLRKGSTRVAAGDQVHVAQQLGEVGNSGSSSEPHLHVQLMDRPSFDAAAGVPFRWTDIDITGEVDPTFGTLDDLEIISDVPADGEVFIAPGR